METDLKLIQEIVLILVISVSLTLGFGVLLSNKKELINRIYFFIAFSIILWVSSGFAVYVASLSNFATILGRLNFAFVALFFVAVYSFFIHFPQKVLPWKKNDILYILTGLILSIVSGATPYVVSNVYANGNNIDWNLGWLTYFYYTYAVTTTCVVFYRLIKNYMLADLINKKKIFTLAVGIGLLAIFNILFNILWPILRPNDYIYWLGDYSVIFFLGFTAYAILKHQLFNIKVIATETIVVLLSIGLLVEVSLSNTLGEGAIKAVVWILATYGGYQLIKAVKIEIKQADDLRVLTKKLELTNKEVKLANEELKKLDKAKDEFISVASHELNTPLAAIEGYLSMILDEHMAKVDEKGKQFLTRAYQSSKRLAALIMDLLNVSRIEQGRIHIQYAETNLCDLVDEVVGELKIKADEKKVGLEYTCPKIPVVTFCDSARIHEVITNLTGNAIKFTDKGKVTLTISADDDKATIAVKDSGIGIDKDDIEKLFHKFSQVDRMENEHQGTGLGLYISKSYVDMHNGRIWAESEGEGKGTTISFELPILKKKPVDPHEGEGAVIRSDPDDEVMQQVMAVSKAHEIKK